MLARIAVISYMPSSQIVIFMATLSPAALNPSAQVCTALTLPDISPSSASRRRGAVSSDSADKGMSAMQPASASARHTARIHGRFLYIVFLLQITVGIILSGDIQFRKT